MTAAQPPEFAFPQLSAEEEDGGDFSAQVCVSQHKYIVKTGATESHLPGLGRESRGPGGCEIGGLCFVWSSGPRDLRCVKVSLRGGWLQVPQRELAAATESHRKLPGSGEMARPAKTGRIFYRVQLPDINARFRAP
ncbi:hypothetical protein AOLI_G00254160 [Acnodon oligacanthus]